MMWLTFWLAVSVWGEAGDSPVESLSASGHQYLTSLKRGGRVFNDSHLEEFLRQKLVALQAPENVKILTISDTRRLALAVPGDTIVLSTGLLLMLADEGELSAVLAHELAHITQHHHEQQWRNARQSNGWMDRLPWIGARRRSQALDHFSADLELAADASAVRKLGDAGGLRRVLNRLSALSTTPPNESLGARLKVLEYDGDRDANEHSQFCAAVKEAQLAALRDLKLRLARHALEDLARARESHASCTLPNDDPDGLAAEPLEIGGYRRTESDSVIRLMDGWQISAPRTWGRERASDGVTLSLDGTALHRIDVRCVAGSRAYFWLGEPASDVTSTRVAQLAADQLLQLEDFHAMPMSERRFDLAGSEGAWIQMHYRDARGIKHLVTSAHVYNGAYFCELRWFTPSEHFYARDEPMFLQLIASLRRP